MQLLRPVLYRIAGVDRETLATCPATDKIWAAHLGFSLCLSFIVVFGISLYAISYLVDEMWLRMLVALVVALTVFMFDRALFQSDWFYHGSFSHPTSSSDREPRTGKTVWRFLRITARLGISFGLAWVLAVFLELAIFADTINEKIQRDHIQTNQASYQRIKQHEEQLEIELEARRVKLGILEAQYREEFTRNVDPEATASRFDRPPPDTSALDVLENSLRSRLYDAQEKIRNQTIDMNAEAHGRRLNQNNSGRPGAGPRYEFAKRQKEVYEGERSEIEHELTQLRVKREELLAAHARGSAEAQAQLAFMQSAAQAKRDALRSQAETARSDLKELEISRLLRIEAFRAKTLESSDFQKQKRDPLSRMTAYQELKNDPKDGTTIVLFSWMTKFLIIFLEIVPVVAKIFFSPPSVYAAMVQAEVEREAQKGGSFEESLLGGLAPSIVANGRPGTDPENADRLRSRETL